MFIPKRRALLRATFGGGAILPLARIDAHAAQSKDPLPRTRDYIVALVRGSPAMNPKLRPVEKIEPVIFKPDPASAPGNALVFDHFVADLHLRYVFDDPQFMLALRVRDLKRLGIDREELPALAVSNFRRRYPKVAAARPERWLGAVANGGELEPSTLLDGAFWARQEQAFGGELIAAVPSATEVYFTPREPKENIELLKNLAMVQYDKAGPRAVSRTVLAWRYYRWEILA